jgi:hypothetical protein
MAGTRKAGIVSPDKPEESLVGRGQKYMLPDKGKLLTKPESVGVAGDTHDLAVRQLPVD